jgi:hypothetical protein
MSCARLFCRTGCAVLEELQPPWRLSKLMRNLKNKELENEQIHKNNNIYFGLFLL